MLLQGTNIAAGKCRGIVVGTGLETEIGMFVSHVLIYFQLTDILVKLKTSFLLVLCTA